MTDNVDETTHLRVNEPYLIAFSGHLGSGKDTVAELVRDGIGGDWVHEFFAAPLKTEVNHLIAIINDSKDVFSAISNVLNNVDGIVDTNGKYASQVVRALYDDVKSGVVTNAYDRTDSTRFALQVWGTEVRRAIEPDYWVRKSMIPTMESLASGKSVYVTDARFHNELDALRDADALLVRLNVSPEEQARRIKDRDGTVVTDAMRQHPSETSADDYPDFDLMFDTDHMTAREIADAIIHHVTAKVAS
jgi:cytidylate kinase